MTEAFLAERDLVGRYILPSAPSGLGALTSTDIGRALQTGITYRPLAETLIDVRNELRAARPGGIEPTLFSRLGVEPGREREVLRLTVVGDHPFAERKRPGTPSSLSVRTIRAAASPSAP